MSAPRADATRNLEIHVALLLPPARLTLGVEIPEAAWVAGRTMTPEQVIAEALKDRAGI